MLKREEGKKWMEKCQGNFSSYLCVRQHDDDEFIDKRCYRCEAFREKEGGEFHDVIECKNASIEICCSWRVESSFAREIDREERWRRLSMHDILAHDIRHTMRLVVAAEERDHRHCSLNLELDAISHVNVLGRSELRKWTCACIWKEFWILHCQQVNSFPKQQQFPVLQLLLTRARACTHVVNGIFFRLVRALFCAIISQMCSDSAVILSPSTPAYGCVYCELHSNIVYII